MSAKKRPTMSDLLNDLSFRTIYNKFRLIASTAFTWSNLPDEIHEKHIENVLFSHGMAAFFKAKDQGFMCLEASPGGSCNVYNEALKYHVTGNGFHKVIRAEELVIVGNNNLWLPTEPIVTFYAQKMAEIERTMDVNVKAVKTPVIFACDDKDVLTFKRIFQQVDGNVPAIFADRGLNIDAIQSYQTGAQFLCNELKDYKNSVENELLTYLGLNNLPTDKKERLITSEADSNNQLIQSFIDMQLDARIAAANEINSKFGLSVSVKKRTVEEVEKDDSDSV